MCRTLLFLICVLGMSAMCCMACRPSPKAGPVELVTLLTDPEQYVGAKVTVRLRIDHYDPATRTATRTVVPGKSPLYRIQMAVGEDDPAIGVLELSGVVDGYDRADTGLGDRLYCIRFKDEKVGAPE